MWQLEYMHDHPKIKYKPYSTAWSFFLCHDGWSDNALHVDHPLELLELFPRKLYY